MGGIYWYGKAESKCHIGGWLASICYLYSNAGFYLWENSKDKKLKIKKWNFKTIERYYCLS